MAWRVVLAGLDPVVAAMLAAQLAPCAEVEVVRAAAGEESLEAALATLPDMVVLDAATASALVHRCRILEAELARARAALGDREVIDQAKARLIRERGLSEPQAYRLLRRQAMNEGRRIADIARDIVAPGNRAAVLRD
jgi:DNA-binding NarL/FixJ family response regulator